MKLESPDFLPENLPLLFLASLLLLCPSCWRLCCCWFSAVMDISAVIVGIPAVTASLLFLASLVPYCCWRPCCYWFPVVWFPSCCWLSDVSVSLLLLASLLLLVPCSCWRLCCWCFPAVGFPGFPLRFINSCLICIPRNGIPSFFPLLEMVRNKIPQVSVSRRNSDE